MICTQSRLSDAVPTWLRNDHFQASDISIVIPLDEVIGSHWFLPNNAALMVAEGDTAEVEMYICSRFTTIGLIQGRKMSPNIPRIVCEA